MTIRCALLSVWAAVKNPLWLIALCIPLFFATLPCFEVASMFAATAEDPLYYKELYDEDAAFFEAEGYDSMPSYLQNLVANEHEALGEICAASTQQEYFSALARYSQALLETYDAGNLTGVERFTLESEVKLYQALSELDDPILYQSTSEMPALNYLSFVLAQNSSVIWFLLPVSSTFVLLRLVGRSKIMGNSPLGARRRTVAIFAAALLLTAFSLVICILPSFIFALAKNGIGTLEYPVVFTQNDVSLFFTLGQTIVKQLALFAVASIFLIVCALAVNALSRNSSIACVITLALSVVPTISGYMGVSAQEAASSGLLSLLPTTYLSMGQITGYPGVFQAVEILSIPDASYELGLAVLLSSCACVAFIGFALSFVRSYISSKRRLAHA